ncbi:MAG: multicopper oxidase domain-containing protein, partial [Chloroflexota bacterium]
MLTRKFLYIMISMVVLTSMLLTAAVQSTSAQESLPVTNAEAPAPGETPHYYGPYPNWANSPQALANAVVTIAPAPSVPVSIGNALGDRSNATDYATAPGVLAPVFVVIPGALPAGTLENFQTWNQATQGGSPTPSAGGLFHAYVLRPTGTASQYQVVYDTGELSVPVLADPAVSEIATFPVVPGFAVQEGDLIGFYGQGIPVGVGGGTDILSYVATTNPDLTTPAAPVLDGIISLGTDPGFPIYSQDRTYSFAATVTPTIPLPGMVAEATATVDPKTGGISAITVVNPGNGYFTAPIVSITAPGMTPTTPASAIAQISTGVLSRIAVVESGFGFTAPEVTITGGNPTVGFNATAIASGGVDDLVLTSGGSGYTIQPVVEFSLPQQPGGVQATGSATMDANGVVNGVAVVNPGSGYTSAPTVTIWDGTLTNAAGTPATAVATISINQIDLTSGGQGYDTVPTVDIVDLGGTASVPASAVATIAVRGAVTAINVTNAGSGYITPGLKKFVDTLPGLGPDAANNLGQYIPVAVPDTTTYPGSDYYEIGVVQYRMQFHSSLPATLLRGYIQLSTSVVPGQHVALGNANFDPALPDTPILLPDGSQAYGADSPHYLGPTIVATKDRPVRILFRNLLPTGEGGDLFLPVDSTLMGAGPGPAMMALDANNVPIDMFPDEGTVYDRIRNPMCNETPKPEGCFADNRATLHLHGGITPWISDGTPHQWTTPAGENTPYPEGVSVSNVPDMPDPGSGAITFFYTNQQSARLLFYHDHAWGITRLNVYAGEAAGYLITDDIEQQLIGTGGALAGLGLGTPLIIQDKTFVPSPDSMAQQDPTWNYNRWGGEGSLWAPHVYMPAQNPSDPTGMSAFGRWMYGPFFWPPANADYPPIANPYYDPACDPDVEPFCEPSLIPGTPNISVGMEAFNDTPLVNGAAYPTTTVEPKAYRYRILNAANDRFWNLSWYVADPRTGTLSEVALNPAELEAAQADPVIFPTPDTTWSPKGPNWIQIGTEGGFLPAPVVLPAQPTTWITDPTRFDVGNVDQHSLLLAPAERADVIVDFSQFRGKTLILYNDAPAAFPARVPGYDYYTGGPDLSPSGAPSTLPGYGPNTRTIMQVKVSNAAPAVAFDRPGTTADRLGTLVRAFAHHTDGSGVFEKGQNPITVGQAAYNSAYGTNFAASGWCSAPSNPSAKCDGYARISEQGGDLFKFDTLAGPQVAIPLEPKGIHDEMNSANFDEFGRMTANIGLEAPGATPLLQNIILYPYVNPATEILDSTNMPSSLNVTPISSAADGTQIWKITHNGVDTHPIHFHLYDIQLLNRVAWDNIISPPDPNELGWKDTIRVNPLQDTYVAIRPIVPVLPFAVPDSIRPLNPMMPLGARGTQAGQNGQEAGFNNTGPTGAPITPIVNEMTNFFWEYVWHCHILSHEEMDMMRPVSVYVPRTLPDAPVLTFTSGSVILNWTDGTPVSITDPATWGNPKN